MEGFTEGLGLPGQPAGAMDFGNNTNAEGLPYIHSNTLCVEENSEDTIASLIPHGVYVFSAFPNPEKNLIPYEHDGTRKVQARTFVGVVEMNIKAWNHAMGVILSYIQRMEQYKEDLAQATTRVEREAIPMPEPLKYLDLVDRSAYAYSPEGFMGTRPTALSDVTYSDYGKFRMVNTSSRGREVGPNQWGPELPNNSYAWFRFAGHNHTNGRTPAFRPIAHSHGPILMQASMVPMEYRYLLKNMPYWTSFWTLSNVAPESYATFEVMKPLRQNLYPFTKATPALRNAFGDMMANGPNAIAAGGAVNTYWDIFMQEYTNAKRTHAVREKALVPLYGRVARGCVETMTDLSDTDREMELLDYAQFTPQIEVDVATVGF
jgi:hypothetical protein